MAQKVFRYIKDDTIFADDWRLVNKTTPNTVPTQFSTGTIVNSSLGTYDAAGTNGRKFIVHWEKPIKKNKNQKIFIVMNQANVLPTLQINDSAFSCNNFLTVRARTIINDFDPNTVTWNNTVVTPTLTYGNSATQTIELDTLATNADNYDSSTSFSVSLVFPMNLTDPVIYGAILDVRGDISGAGSLSANGIFFSINNGTKPNKPYVLIP